MRKLLTIILALLLVGWFAHYVFASVGASVSGTLQGAATDIDVPSATTSNFDGSVLKITAYPKGVSALTAAGSIIVNLSSASVFTFTPVIPTTMECTQGYSGDSATMVFTAAGTRGVITFTGTFKANGTLDPGATTGKISVIEFANDSIGWKEQGRSERY